MKTQKNKHVRRSQRDYTLAFKLAVVDEVEKGRLTYKQAQRKYGIQGRSMVLVWLRKHGTLDWSPSTESAMSPRTETPEQTIKRLEQEVRDLSDTIYLHSETIRVIDEATGSNYRKKLKSLSSKAPNRQGK